MFINLMSSEKSLLEYNFCMRKLSYNKLSLEVIKLYMKFNQCVLLKEANILNRKNISF